MARRFVDLSSRRKIVDTSTPMRRVDPDKVAEALGAELVYTSSKPLDLFETRDTLKAIAGQKGPLSFSK